jgi:hypothetical protein
MIMYLGFVIRPVTPVSPPYLNSHGDVQESVTFFLNSRTTAPGPIALQRPISSVTITTQLKIAHEHFIRAVETETSASSPARRCYQLKIAAGDDRSPRAASPSSLAMPLHDRSHPPGAEG